MTPRPGGVSLVPGDAAVHTRTTLDAALPESATVFSSTIEMYGMTERTLTVSGMSCGGCEQNVEDALAALDGVTSVEADHEGDAVELATDGSVPDADIRTAIVGAGYEVST